ncbi:MAG: bifunctional hydroxymethylpyrimidine kinase/phosphomethylpyrimidine kinase [Candidatus Micrarchaeaceae archaeon]
MKFAMTIAGSDSSAGAGMQQDLKVCTMLGVYCATVITSITAQNTYEVTAIHDVPPKIVEMQIDEVMKDFPVVFGKTGMLSSYKIVNSVVRKAKEYGLKLVVDPVMIAKSGAVLLKRNAISALKRSLLSIAYFTTPNAYEAEIISGIKVDGIEGMYEAARRIKDLGPSYVVIKGGHVGGEKVTDVLYDGKTFKEFTYNRISTEDTHGGGDTLAAAIASYLSRGYEPVQAYSLARRFMQKSIMNSLRIGNGHGPVNPMYSMKAFRNMDQ